MPTAFCGFNDAPGVAGANLLVAHGPTLAVQIGFDEAYREGQVPRLPENRIAALVDTGATECCIDSGLAMQLNLPIVDRRLIAGVGGAHEVNVHLAQVYIQSLQLTMFGAFAAVALAAGGQQHAALLGRTMLVNFTMVYYGATGTVVISNEPNIHMVPPLPPVEAG